MSNIPNMHDAELHALHHDPITETIQCTFRTAENQQIALVLSGVKKFRCTDFGLQNVVLDLLSTAWQKSDTIDLQSHVSWLSMNEAGDQLANPEEIEQTIQSIVSGKLQALFLIPSWGSQLGAVASAVQWKLLIQ
jgi:hypothetical protein